MRDETRRALLVGGGIAGPVLGMFLQRAGVEATVFEGQPAARDEAGAFLNLAPNGLAVLDALGIGGEVDAAGTATSSIEFVNHRGKRLGGNPEGLLLIKRGALNRVLREQARCPGRVRQAAGRGERRRTLGDGPVRGWQRGDR
jgi:FAD-dependent urate hydroxylase